MKGRTVWRESPSPSICTFCAHRWGAGVSRRSIHSSRPASSSEAAAFAARRNDETSQDSDYQASPNDSARNLPNSTRARGRPVFGRQAPQTRAKDFSSLLFGSKPAQVTLSEEEKHAKLMVEDNAAMQNPVPVPVRRIAKREAIDTFGEPAPELTRAGRPEPMSESVINLLRESERRKTSAIDLHHARRFPEANDTGNQQTSRRNTTGQQGKSNFAIRRLDSRVFGEETVEVKKTSQNSDADAESSRLEQSGPWRQLRIRRDWDFGPSTSQDTFLKGRSERENRGKAGAYTPILDQFTYPSSDETAVRRQSPVESGHQQSALDEVDPEDDQALRRERQHWPAKESDSGKLSRFQRFDQLPKGRDRDKSRRREQFVTNDEDIQEARAEQNRAELKKQRRREKAAAKAAKPTPIFLPEYISVSNLATALRVRVDDFIGKMAELGFEETQHDHILNSETAGLIAMEYNFEPIANRSESEDLKARPAAKDRSILPSRPPVVTIMGHVDHGKTTLLDWLRKSSVAATEHGGITQHIGAFSVPMPSGKVITFLDTPGHAAFLSMRQRGANVTDIVVLVVAADDSVKPQTVEAINHAKAAKVPIIVAINKIDKEDANVQRVKQDLARFSVDVEDFGGDTQVVCVSGKTGQGMQELEEAIITLSEIVDMRAERDGPAEGWVIEASMQSAGKVATVLVRRGTMRPGDFIVAGQTWAKIRTLRNEGGAELEEALPGTPVVIEGWRDQPLAGDEVLQAPDESKAKDVVEYRIERAEREKLAQDMEAINEDRKETQLRREQEKKEAELAEEQEDGHVRREEPEKDGLKLINFIVKGDVSGSIEAINDSVSAIGNQEIQPRILRSAVGQISEFDIEHAAAANGYIINFNIPVDPYISRLAERSGVKILDHNVIYRLCDDVKAKLSEELPPILNHKVLGEADIIQVFNITIKGRNQKPVAGCKVRNGTISRSGAVRVFRNGEKVFDGFLESLKSGKKDVTEMHKGNECGLGFENWNGFQEGDQIQTYETIEEKRYL